MRGDGNANNNKLLLRLIITILLKNILRSNLLWNLSQSYYEITLFINVSSDYTIHKTTKHLFACYTILI